MEVSIQNDPRNEIYTKQFNHKEKIWIRIKFQTTCIKKEKLSFISYNTWRDQHNRKNRLAAQLQLFKKYSPDFICLQEVTLDYFQMLSDSKFIQQNYYISSNFESGRDVLILSKYPVKFYKYLFQLTFQKKKLLYTEIYLGEFKPEMQCIVATSHFEGLNAEYFRINQLEETFKILKSAPTCFLNGDFNFDSSWGIEEAYIDKKFSDAWLLHKTLNNLKDEEGLTMGSEGDYPPWRPDRILYKGNNVKLEKFEIIGRDPIEVDSKQNFSSILTPSDHFGLFGIFSVKKTN
jgi:tyrosyl-DNA phosphodiesterase 2